MTDGLDQVEDALEGKGMSRRGFLATAGAGVTAALAGCSTGTGTEDDTTTAPTTTEQPTTEEPTTEEPTTTEEEDTIAGVEVAEMENSFEEIYKQTYNQDTNHLSEEQVEELQGQSPVRQLEQAADTTIRESIDATPTKINKGFKEIMHNDLDYTIDEVIIDKRDTGGGETYGTLFTNQDGNWIKNLSYMGGFLEFNERNDNIGEPWKDRLANIWEHGEEKVGAATGVEKWRKGVEAADTFQGRLNRKELLSAAMTPDINNDTMIIGYDTDKAFQDYWGKVGYTREGIETIAQTQDLFENEDFEKEIEVMKGLTEFFHNELPTPYGKDIPVDEETYIRVGTRTEIEEDLEQGIGENPYPIAKSTEKELWATTVGYEEHKKDAFNWDIPENQWPEKSYPNEGLNLSEDLQNKSHWVWAEDEEK